MVLCGDGVWRCECVVIVCGGVVCDGMNEGVGGGESSGKVK